MLISDFARAVSVLILEYHGSVTSWWRTARHNAAVGGVPASPHERGLAVDIVWDEPPLFEQLDVAARSHGLLVLRESNHDHLQPLDERKGASNA